MELTLFILCASIGIVSTVVILRFFMRKGPLSNKKYALILSIGFFSTWFCSFMIPLLPSGSVNNLGIILFGLGHSALVGLLTYWITRILLALTSRSK